VGQTGVDGKAGTRRRDAAAPAEDTSLNGSAGARLPVTWPPDPARQAALEALESDRPSYRSAAVPARLRSHRTRRNPERFGELLARWSGRGTSTTDGDPGTTLPAPNAQRGRP
jgi:hypothetical protein